MKSCCPECSAEGFDGVLVLAGTQPFDFVGLRPVFFVAALFMWSLGISIPAIMRVLDTTPKVAGLSPELVWVDIFYSACPFVSMIFMLFTTRHLTGLQRLWGNRRASVAWSVHIGGIELRDGASRHWVAREVIKGIRCRDVVFANASILELEWMPTFIGGSSVAKRSICIRGSRESRREQWRAARRVLGLLPS